MHLLTTSTQWGPTMDGSDRPDFLFRVPAKPAELSPQQELQAVRHFVECVGGLANAKIALEMLALIGVPSKSRDEDCRGGGKSDRKAA